MKYGKLIGSRLCSTDVIDEIIAPTNLAFHPAQVVGFTVNLALLLYYKGCSLNAALPEAWLRDERARQHTDLLLLRSGEKAVSFVWCPQNRPLGCSLQYCTCQRTGNTRWRYQGSKCSDYYPLDGFEYHYQCTGCHSELTVWVQKPEDYRLIEACGTSYAQTPWPIPPINLSAKLSAKENST
jgi:hypothetical protein